MAIPLRVLLIEDNEDDAVLILRQLKRGGYETSHLRVDTFPDVVRALEEGQWDVVLCDYRLPGFDGLQVLSLYRQKGLEAPFIVCSGTIGEETAVAAMRAGADDYVMKDKLSLLGPAVERALQAAAVKRELRRTEANLASIINSTNHWIWAVDAEEFRLVTFNDALVRHFAGRGVSLRAGMAPEELPPGEEALSWRERYGRALKEGPFRCECRPFASERTFLVSFAPVRKGEDLLAVAVFGEDVTEMKEAEERLRSREAHYRLILENMHEGYHEVNLKGDFTFFNPAFRRIMGYEEGELLGMNYRTYGADPQNVKKVFEAYNRVFRTGEPLEGFEWDVLTKDKGRRTVEVSASLIRDREGKPVGFRGLVRDVTDRKAEQERIRRAEEQYRSIFDNAQEGIYRVTPEGRILLANTAMAKMFGYASPQEFIAAVTDTASQLYADPAQRSEVVRIMGEKGFVRGLEARMRRRDGSEFWVSMSMWAVRDEEGRIVYYEGIDEDITERKEHVERLKRTLEAAVGAISSVVEIRDPYTAGHQRRVAHLAAAVGREMSLDEARIDGLRMAAGIHDIGKISVPAEILAMPRRLTDIEMDLVKIHPQAGYEILRDIDFPWPVALMVYQHHERLDGSGYPRGLRGEEIILEARILAVADVVEAISSHRPYRPRLGLGAAVEELKKNVGVLYDPEVVAACLRIIQRDDFLFPGDPGVRS